MSIDSSTAPKPYDLDTIAHNAISETQMQISCFSSKFFRLKMTYTLTASQYRRQRRKQRLYQDLRFAIFVGFEFYRRNSLVDFFRWWAHFKKIQKIRRLLRACFLAWAEYACGAMAGAVVVSTMVMQ